MPDAERASGCPPGQPGRVLILGLDGATFSVLDPLLERGIMPNLAALLARGVRGILHSTDPYVTAPAWTSLATGKRPDTHGVFDWTAPVPGRYQRRVVSSMFRRDQAFWEILAGRGIPAGSINLPLTYPPSTDTSFCISDMFTPSPRSEYTHPRSLKRELEAMGYRIDLRKSDYFQRGFEAYVRDLEAMTRVRGRVIRMCLERYPWRAAIAVFVGPDRLQHPFWHHLELGESLTPEARRAIEFFRVLDEELGEIVDLVGSTTHVYCVSDHGFGPHRGAFYVNDWLQAQGYLVLKSEPRHVRAARAGAQAGLRRAEGKVLRRLEAPGGRRWTGGMLGRVHRTLERLGDALGDELTPGAAVDWERTVAFADTPHGIRLNVRGREARGIVTPARYESLRQEIAAALREVMDPLSGAPLHSEVAARETRYYGSRTGLAPDLMYTFRDTGYSWRIGRIDDLAFGRRIEGTFLVTGTEWETGTHRPEGILIAAGPEIRTAVVRQYHLWDLVPTLLYHLEQEIPPDLEGLVMRDVFRPEVLARRPERWGGQPAVRPGREGSSSGSGSAWWGSPADQAAVAEHLRALGYLA